MIFSGIIDNSPENGGVAIGGQGNVFFGNDYNSAVVYEAAYTPTIGVGGTTTTGTTPTSTTTPTSSTPPRRAQPHRAPPRRAPPRRAAPLRAPPRRRSRLPASRDGRQSHRPGTLFVGDFPPTPVSCAPGTTHCVAVLGSTSVVTVTGQTGQGVAVTSDLSNWSGYSSLPSQFFQVLSISCPTSTQCVAAGYGPTDNPVIAFSTNGGVSWTEANMSPFNPASGWPQAVTCPSALVCYIVGGTVGPPAPMAAISTDGGQDWTVLDKDLPELAGLLPGGHLVFLGVELRGRRSAVGHRSRHRHIDDVQRDYVVPVAVVRLRPVRGLGVGVVPDRYDGLLRQRLSREPGARR